jgi:hypothetical protein
VYWTRRLLVLGVAFALVFAIARLLSGPGGDPSATVSARQAGARASVPSSGPTPGASTIPSSEQSQKPPQSQETAKSGGKASTTHPAKEKTPLAIPTGPCADDDIQVDPSVDGASYAGSDVVITLNLTTLDSPACNWEVTPQSVVLKITSGKDRIWSTQDCPHAVKSEPVVVRSGHKTKVYVTWNGQRSDGECSRTTGWAEPGYYHAEAAALGSEPTDEQFRLDTPVRPTITPKPKPDKKHTQSG